MANLVFRAIGVRITQMNGELIDVADLAPLLLPEHELLRQIATSGGPCIHPSSVRKGSHRLVFAALDGVPVLCECLCEETSVQEETEHLVRARQTDLARAFKSLMSNSQPPSAMYGDDSAAMVAVFVLTAAFLASKAFIHDGVERQNIHDYIFEVRHLRVTESKNGPVFEPVCSSLDQTALSARVH